MFKRILVAIDGSETSRHALDAALELAKDSDASLRVVYVLTDPLVYWDSPGYDPSIMRKALSEEGARLNTEATDLMHKHGVRGDTRIVDAGAMGDIPTFIVRAAGDYQAQLLVLGTHGRRGVPRFLLGSVAEHCVRLTALPVLLVPWHESAHPAPHP
jgi:nucleotide-binding universal stress UspA family protein